MKADIVNVVATATLNQRLDLYELGQLRYVVHDTAIYGGMAAYFKSPNMKGKVSVFASGKMISVGTKNEEQAIRELEHVKNLLHRHNFINLVDLQCKIQNIVVSADFGRILDLGKLRECIYEPEQFPAAIMRIKDPNKATALVFASGKAVITGLTSQSQIEPTLRRIQEIIRIAE